MCVYVCVCEYMIYGNIRARPPQRELGMSLHPQQFLKEELLDDVVSAVLEIPQILPVVLSCHELTSW